MIFRNLEALTLALTFNGPEPEGPTAGGLGGPYPYLTLQGGLRQFLHPLLMFLELPLSVEDWRVLE